MTHGRISLDGPWSFVHRAAERVAPGPVRTAEVPAPWQAQFPDLRMKVGFGTYRRDFDCPAPGYHGERIYLHFGAVFHLSTVWVNGHRVGGHEGGFLPFSFDVTAHLVPGRNEVTVEALTPSDDSALYPEAPFGEIPFGKQSWYGPLSGIWQSVWLERRHADHVERIRVRSAALSGAVEADVAFRSPLSRNAALVVEILDPVAIVVASARWEVAESDATLSVGLAVPDVQPWGLDSPQLYQIRVTLVAGGTPVDQHAESFGFRSIETRQGAFYLNGKRLYLRGALDQDYYPDTICSVPSVAFLEDEFRKAKALGLNCLRLHIKAPDPRYYEVADRVGLLIWTELPNGGLTTERSRKRKERLLKGIVDRDGNHPSIVIWTIINENWGVDLVHDADHRAWLKRTFAWLKAYDPTRLVVDNSPLAPSFHVQTDIADYHFYAAIPDHRASWDNFVDRLASSTSWLFSSEGDAVVTGEEPRLCSEFGNWGLPRPAELRGADGQEPWWFESGHDWGEGVMYPHGIEQRFGDWVLDSVFGSLDAFVDAVQWQQYRALKYQIERMRRRPELAAYIITELTDVHWESNGLLDMRRNPRVFHDEFRSINADTIIVPEWDRLSYWAGETARISLSVAHHGVDEMVGARLTVKSGDTSEILDVPPVGVGEVCDLGPVTIVAAGPGSASHQRVGFDLLDRDGALLARNTIDMAVHAPPSAAHRAGVTVWSSDPDTRACCKALGYRVGFSAEDTDVIIATKPDTTLAGLVRRGSRVLLLPAASCALQPFFPHWQDVRVRKRERTVWQGDWASSFSWLRRTGVFAGLPGGPLLDEAFDRVLPNHIVTGCNLLDFHSRVHAAMVVGWVHRPAALVVERRYGQGNLVTSTFRLFRDPAHADPTATKLIDSLIQLTAGARPVLASSAPDVSFDGTVAGHAA